MSHTYSHLVFCYNHYFSVPGFCQLLCGTETVADPDISFGGPRGAEGARIEAPSGVGCGEGLGVESGEGV